MTREELRDYVDEQRGLNNIPYHVYSTLIDGIDTLEQQSCEDAISMMDLLNNLHKHFSKGFETDEWWNSTHVLQAVKDCRPELFDLNYVSPVQPKPKIGHWISHYDEDAKEGWYECDRCHTERAFNTKFCPDCGCRMFEPQESEG